MITHCISLEFSFADLAEARIKFDLFPNKDREHMYAFISQKIKASLGEDKYYCVLGSIEYRNLYLTITDIVRFKNLKDENSYSRLEYLVNIKREYELRVHYLWNENINPIPSDFFYINIRDNHLLLLLDEQDYARLSKYTIQSPQGVPFCSQNLVHREIAEKMFGDLGDSEIDHINGNRFDARRSNLRKCSSQQNSYNRGLTRRNTTGYKGVSQPKKVAPLYMATIHVDGQRIHIGNFINKRDAAIAYDIYAKQYHGEFAKLNVFDTSKDDLERVNNLIKLVSRKQLTSSYYGVSLCRSRRERLRPWAARYRLNGKGYFIGNFATEREAADAVEEKLIALGSQDQPRLKKNLTPNIK